MTKLAAAAGSMNSELDPDLGPARDGHADRRDQVADERDAIADQRDAIADHRDRIAQRFEALIQVGITADTLEWSAVARRDAKKDRQRALASRKLTAVGRRQADRDRGSAQLVRETAAGRESHAVDDLTGLYRRNEGFAELTREMARARREATQLVVAFVDVDGLKAINDSRGHAAGDAMLVAVARTLQRELRVYDVIFRYGGDEIVCALPGINRDEATNRFVSVNDSLKAGAEHGSITVGLADMQRDDSAIALVARADEALYIERRRLRAATANISRQAT